LPFNSLKIEKLTQNFVISPKGHFLAIFFWMVASRLFRSC
jgi:hypothetical protein